MTWEPKESFEPAAAGEEPSDSPPFGDCRKAFAELRSKGVQFRQEQPEE